jgi:hypothetical protein
MAQTVDSDNQHTLTRKIIRRTRPRSCMGLHCGRKHQRNQRTEVREKKELHPPSIEQAMHAHQDALPESIWAIYWPRWLLTVLPT